MFKVKVRPNKNNRYLYDINLYERTNFGIFWYWKLYYGHEGITNSAIYEHLKRIQCDYKIYAIDFLLSQEIDLTKK